MYSHFALSILTVSALAYTTSAYAFIGLFDDGKSKKDQKTIEQVIVETVFSETEKAIIEEYFGKQETKEHKKQRERKAKAFPPVYRKT